MTYGIEFFIVAGLVELGLVLYFVGEGVKWLRRRRLRGAMSRRRVRL